MIIRKREKKPVFLVFYTTLRISSIVVCPLMVLKIYYIKVYKFFKSEDCRLWTQIRYAPGQILLTEKVIKLNLKSV